MKKKLTALLVGAALMLAAGSAFAIPYVDNVRPYTNGATGLSALQNVLDANIDGNTINAVSNQSTVGGWVLSESGASRSYLVAADTTLDPNKIAGALYIYSLTDSSKFASLIAGADKKTTFDIDGAGNLFIGEAGSPTIAGFGSAFGFYYKQGTVKAYTQDGLNTSSDVKALSYQLATGTTLEGQLGSYFSNKVTNGNDDWILAFETEGTRDFTDGVFYVKDIAPVPEPGTMVLLGAGLLGLAIYGKRRMNKEA